MDRLTRWVLSFGGLGYAPLAPGTAGTAGAVAVAFLLPGGEAWLPAAAGVILLSSLLTIGLTPRAERLAGKKDPGLIVLDEVAGYFVTVLPFGGAPGWLLMGFLAFRVLDVAKPWPGRRFERLPGGVGVLLDDLLAGAYGLLFLLALRRLTGWSGML